MANGNPPQPYWPWCAQPGAGRSTTLTVDTANYGDGYVHRATRGLNPARPAWTLAFPFTSLDELQAYDDFLTEWAGAGFYIMPPDGTDYVLVTADSWQATITDRNVKSGIIGTLNATFTRSFNPQPISLPT
jgi:phage-related protein